MLGEEGAEKNLASHVLSLSVDRLIQAEDTKERATKRRDGDGCRINVGR